MDYKDRVHILAVNAIYSVVMSDAALETPTIFNARASNQTHKYDIVFNTLPIEISESTCVVVGK